MSVAPPVNSRAEYRHVTGMLSEHASKQLLKEWSVPVTRDRLLPAQPINAADLSGVVSPVALKIVSRDIPHKSEIGGVHLHIRNAAELVTAGGDMLTRVQQAMPAAKLDGLLVSEMITDGIETIVGGVNDSAFGPVIAFGLGGCFAGTLRDITYRRAPFDVETRGEMIGE